MKWLINRVANGRYEVLTASGKKLDDFDSHTAAMRRVYALALQTLTAAADQKSAGRFYAECIPEGEPTSDGRQFNQGALYWRDPPLPMMLQTETQPGHFGAELAGRIDTVRREGDLIILEGDFDDSQAGHEFVRICSDHDRYGLSGDIGDMEAEFECSDYDDEGYCIDGTLMVSRAELIGATGTPFPAFAQAFIKLAGEPGEALVASVPSIQSYPLSERDKSWDAGAARQRWEKFCSSDGSGDMDKINWTKFHTGFFYFDADNPETVTGHKLGYVDVIDGRAVAVWNAINAVAAVLSGGRGGVQGISPSERSRIESQVCTWYSRAKSKYDDEEITCPFESETASATDAEATSMEPIGPIARGAIATAIASGLRSLETGSESGRWLERLGDAIQASMQRRRDGAGSESSASHERSTGGSTPSREAAAQSVAEGLTAAVSSTSITTTKRGRSEGSSAASAISRSGNSGMTRNDLRRHSATSVRWLDEVRAAGGPLNPPAEWFTDPELSELTPLTITDDGRIFGHVAPWDACHIGRDDICLTAPPSASEYAYFHTGAIRLDEQERAIGVLTMDTGHAPTTVGAQSAAAHYDNTGVVVADIAVGEDIFGPWFSGALRSDLTDEQIRKLRASSVSGDWRRIGGHLELVAVLAVNTPGFPVPRARVASGEIQALVAAGSRAIAERRDPHVRRITALEQRVERAEKVLALFNPDAADRLIARLNDDQRLIAKLELPKV